MRGLYGRANAAKQLQPLSDRQLVAVAVVREWPALDVLHYEVRKTVIGRTRVHQRRDVGMIQRAEDLPLPAEARDDLVGAHSASDDLDGHVPLEFRLQTHAEVHGAHA